MAWIIQMINKADPVLMALHPFARVFKGNRFLFVSENSDADPDENERLPGNANQAAFDAQLLSQNPNGKHMQLTKKQASKFAPQEVIEEL